MFERFGFSLEQGERIPDCEYCLYMDWHFVCVLKFMVFTSYHLLKDDPEKTFISDRIPISLYTCTSHSGLPSEIRAMVCRDNNGLQAAFMSRGEEECFNLYANENFRKHLHQGK
mgnify:CR=1 FL=1